MAKVSLSSIVNLPAFEEAAEVYHAATNMTVSFPDSNGNTVFYPAEERCGFCQIIQRTAEGRARCQQSDKAAAEAALKEKRPMWYTCHAGLIDVVVPISSGDQKIGCFYSGQSLIAPPTPMGFEDVRRRVEDLDVDEEELEQAYQQVRQVDGYRLEMAVQLLSIIGNHLVRDQIELGRQRELTRLAEQDAKLERDLREMELRLSQTQLNPHFLFNSLNLILGEALNEDAQKTAHLVEDLSELLSNALTTIGSMVTLAAEMNTVEAYVSIFQARFSKEIELKMHLPKSLARYRVPSLVLQPLVENALVHAFPKCDYPFEIEINARKDNGSVELAVSDNGPGMPKQKLSALSKALNSTEHAAKLTGLRGLSRRLDYYYSKPLDLRLTASPSGGLSVILLLPSSTRPLGLSQGTASKCQ